MNPRRASTRGGTRPGDVAERVLEITLLVLGVFVLFDQATTLWLPTIWCGIGVVYLVIAWVGVWYSVEHHQPDFLDATGSLLDRIVDRIGWLFPLATAFVGGITAFRLVGARSAAAGLDRALETGLAALTLIVSWLLLHAGFARIYAYVDRHLEGARFDFPGTKHPTMVSYAYLAITIGATFATSDVTVSGTRGRATVMAHTIVSFLFNAGVLGFAVNALAA